MNSPELDIQKIFTAAERDFSADPVPKYGQGKWMNTWISWLPVLLIIMAVMVPTLFYSDSISESALKSFYGLYNQYTAAVFEITQQFAS